MSLGSKIKALRGKGRIVGFWLEMGVLDIHSCGRTGKDATELKTESEG